MLFSNLSWFRHFWRLLTSDPPPTLSPPALKYARERIALVRLVQCSWKAGKAKEVSSSQRTCLVFSLVWEKKCARSHSFLSSWPLQRFWFCRRRRPFRQSNLPLWLTARFNLEASFLMGGCARSLQRSSLGFADADGWAEEATLTTRTGLVGTGTTGWLKVTRIG